MKHDERTEQIYALIDGLLSTEEEEDINEHLAECDECRLLHKTLIADNETISEGIQQTCSKSHFAEKVVKNVERITEKVEEKSLPYTIRNFITSVRIIYATAAIVVFSTILIVGISHYREVRSRFGKIAKLDGLAWCKRGDTQFMLNSADIIRFEDEVITENDSKLHILTRENHVITMNANTRMAIGENDRKKQEISIKTGEVFIDSNHSGRKYAVHAQNSEIRNLGTKFNIKVIPALLTPSIVNVAVESGKAVVDVSEKSINLESGENAVLVENRLERIERSSNVERLTKWRWNLKDILEKPYSISLKEKDPFTGRLWIASGRQFIIPEDENADEYDTMSKIIVSMRERLEKPVEATSITFTEDFIYIGSIYGIFRYNRETRTLSLIIPDYGIVGSCITEIKVSDDGNSFDIAFRRLGSRQVEYITIDQASFPMILNFDLLSLQPLASAE